eukprot:1629326-Amphidinium_carterae.1
MPHRILFCRLQVFWGFKEITSRLLELLSHMVSFDPKSANATQFQVVELPRVNGSSIAVAPTSLY